MTSIGASMCSDYTTPRLKKNARCLSRSQILGACPPCPQHVLLPNPLLVDLVLCAVGRLEVYAVVIRKVEEVVQHVRELLFDLVAFLPLLGLLAVEARFYPHRLREFAYLLDEEQELCLRIVVMPALFLAELLDVRLEVLQRRVFLERGHALYSTEKASAFPPWLG